MNIIFAILVSIAAIVALPIVATMFIRAIWEILEIPYRIVMIVFYGSCYLIITAWEVVVWLALLPFKISDWARSLFHAQ